MDKQTIKDLRNMAFAVGFGLTIGKYFGNQLGSFINGAMKGTLIAFAKNGNEFSQNICKNTGLIYEEKQDKNETNVKMGFHYE